MRSSREIFRTRIALLAALIGFASCFTDITHTPRLDGGHLDGGGAGTGSVDTNGGASGEAGIFVHVDASATGGVGGGSGNLDGPSSLGGSAADFGGGSVADGPSIQLDAVMMPDAPADVPLTTTEAGPDQPLGNDALGPSPNGASCQAGSTCASKNCVDGVCCDTAASACSGCNACSNAMTGKADGTCAAAITGQNPHKSCVDETATKPCGNDGTCDGAGACRKVSTSQACTKASCSAGIFTPAATCDGLGACKTVTAQNCAPFQCDTTGCLKTCTSPSDCDATTSYCDTAIGKCAPKKINGTAASLGTECTSGVVADGVCCNKACTGCYACSGSPLTGGAAGQCLAVLANQVAHNACTASGTTCGLDGKCDGAGACSYTPKAGASCDDPSNLCVTGKTCQNGMCVGGTTKTCAPPTAKCRNPGVCDPSTGVCNYGLAANNSACDDNNACTTNDTCQNGTCAGTLVTCTAPPCQTGGTCSAGVCPTPGWANDGTRDIRCLSLTPVCVSGLCAQCFSDSDCSGNANTPSCDTGRHTCTCRKPSAGNLIQNNPGFDLSLAGWSAYWPPMQSTWSNDDSESCPGSGSVEATNGTDTDPMQCVSLNGAGAGTYFFGAKFKLPLAGNGTVCTVSFNSDQYCSDVIGTPANMGPNHGTYGGSGWQQLWTTATAPVGSLSAFVFCSFDLIGGATRMDQIYLNKGANNF